MRISGFHRHIFWSYKADADLPEELVVRHVILYGELEDMILLTKKIDSRTIEKVLQSLSSAGHNKKRINFFQKVIMD